MRGCASRGCGERLRLGCRLRGGGVSIGRTLPGQAPGRRHSCPAAALPAWLRRTGGADVESVPAVSGQRGRGPGKRGPCPARRPRRL
ncbi:hypothetical protein G6F59_017683 [Rhizopus arrhizus]|nr:hypothetical protein G6F59_017683 [Rhizopus arrhizus]